MRKNPWETQKRTHSDRLYFDNCRIQYCIEITIAMNSSDVKRADRIAAFVILKVVVRKSVQITCTVGREAEAVTVYLLIFELINQTNTLIWLCFLICKAVWRVTSETGSAQLLRIVRPNSSGWHTLSPSLVFFFLLFFPRSPGLEYREQNKRKKGLNQSYTDAQMTL